MPQVIVKDLSAVLHVKCGPRCTLKTNPQQFNCALIKMSCITLYYYCVFKDYFAMFLYLQLTFSFIWNFNNIFFLNIGTEIP